MTILTACEASLMGAQKPTALESLGGTIERGEVCATATPSPLRVAAARSNLRVIAAHNLYAPLKYILIYVCNKLKQKYLLVCFS